ncbi:DNA translocase FtsK [Sphingobium sufflavum]|uniref:DNA translocase FtsK n=1 Tax=Sphingobium sufflavum TaxID=1129547 RepID=UPI00389ACF41
MDGPAEPTPRMFEAHDGRPVPDRPAPAPSASNAELFTTALSLVIDHQTASASWLQRQLRIGYNAAARLIAELETRGVVGPPNHVGKRDVLIPPNGEAHPALALMVERYNADMAAKGLPVSASIAESRS